VDGAHNPNGAKALRESINTNFPNQKVKFIFGCLRNKKYKEMMESLFTGKDEIYFYHFDNPNSCSLEELNSACSLNSKSFDDFKLDSSVPTIICGSFYMLKELLTKMGIK
jgi:dihydrofolate synthase/folylpolyglutamate synthase